ncbi:MAG: radical SAM protein [Deltaproteobacteria bacterium]|nr:radical SAM protein [Deltaproteobacteria bacterium]
MTAPETPASKEPRPEGLSFPARSDPLAVSRLFRGRRDPVVFLESILGEPYREYRVLWERSGRGELSLKFPLHVDYELRSVCNYRCPMCLFGDPAFTREGALAGTELSLELVKDLVSFGVERGQKALGFGGLWEPLLHPDTPAVVRFARERGILDLMLSTNGSVLNRKLSRELADSGLTRLSVSLDAVTEETYRKMRPGGTLKAAEDGIEAFLAARRETGSALPLLRLSFLVTKFNEHELRPFLERWRDLCDFFSVQRYGCYRDKGREPLFPSETREADPFFLCPQPFQRLLVRHNGDVLPCCDLSALDFPVGNVRRSSLAEIWEGEKMKGFRAASRDPGAAPGVCRRCREKYRKPPEKN